MALQRIWYERSGSLIIIGILIAVVVIINKQKQTAAVKAQSSLLLAEQQQIPAYPKNAYAFPAYVDATNRFTNGSTLIQAEIATNHLGTMGNITVGPEALFQCDYLCAVLPGCKQSVFQSSTGLCELKSQISPTTIVDPEWVAFRKANPGQSYFSKSHTRNFV